MLQKIDDLNEYKRSFKQKFNQVLKEYIDFRLFLYEIFFERHTAYVVGGFLRDIVLGVQSRDLDMILGVSPEVLDQLLTKSKLNYKKNRLGGAKLLFNNFEIDIWSIDSNWSFRTNLIKRNEQKIVDNIAEGAFYNFDSLVINVLSYEVCVKHFNKCVEKNELDILRKNKNYRKHNPTIEANIIRAFYLKNKFNLNFSKNCDDYLIRRIKFLKDNYNYAINRLIEIKRRYPKYDNQITDDILKIETLTLLRKDRDYDEESQVKLNF
jgi:hypothetical protein